MASKERHIFPGNNTSEGFFSYYHYILGQQEANRIYCIKGGPGVGKSTFMKKIGQDFFEKGEDIDFLHCSADNESLDGIVLKNRKVALIDATAPHVVDPVNPGAVDSIIHLGEFWNEESLRQNKSEVIENNLRVKKWFAHAYHYLAAAGNLYDNMSEVYKDAVENAEVYKLAAQIVGDELSYREICLKPGRLKKFFASAITPNGIVNQLKSLIAECNKVYLISSPIGVSNEKLLNIFSESAIFRGIDVEEYYCSMKPQTKLEHIILPEMGIALISLNQFHDLELWEINMDTVLIDINDIISWNKIEPSRELLNRMLHQMTEMLNEGVACIKNAKQEHDKLETRFYIPNMDFKKIDILRDEIIAKIQ